MNDNFILEYCFLRINFIVSQYSILLYFIIYFITSVIRSDDKHKEHIILDPIALLCNCNLLMDLHLVKNSQVFDCL